ncbi:MAG TPA: hypothetical protein VJ798_00820 [Rhizomicrobium sp.]|nr:hypothetical protein [Rhizomicrobium sp.]
MAGNAARTWPDGILGNIGFNGTAGGLIPLPQAARPEDVYRSSLTRIDLAPATAQAMEKIRADLHAPARWSARDSTVNLSEEMASKADAIARHFHDRTGKNLVVNSGFRTPAAQARAMYEKFALGDTTTYVGPSGKEVRAIYDEAIAAKRGRDAALESMVAKIAEQLANGRPVSKHLLERAIDFGTKEMTKAEVKLLQDAIRQQGGVPLYEGKPPHLHASFPPPSR